MQQLKLEGIKFLIFSSLEYATRFFLRLRVFKGLPTLDAAADDNVVDERRLRSVLDSFDPDSDGPTTEDDELVFFFLFEEDFFFEEVGIT